MKGSAASEMRVKGLKHRGFTAPLGLGDFLSLLSRFKSQQSSIESRAILFADLDGFIFGMGKKINYFLKQHYPTG